MHRDGVWFRRFAEVPGVGYAGDLALRAGLAERDAVPEVDDFDFDGVRTASLSWKTPDGSTSASPVHRLAYGERGDTIPELRYCVLSALELPGQISDYHFAMQGVATELWKRRSEDPSQIAFVEWVCTIDARLVETHPEPFRITPGEDEYVSVFAFEFLVDLHEREGFLREALMLASRFARFSRRTDDLTSLRERVARLDAEQHGMGNRHG